MLRRRWRLLLSLAGLAFASFTLWTQAGELQRSVISLPSVSWGWLLLGLVGSALTYPLSALTLRGASGTLASLGRLTELQLATSFANLFAPQGIAGLALTERFLERVHLDRASAVAAVLLNNAWYAGVFGCFLVASPVSLRDTRLGLLAAGHWPALAIAALLLLSGLIVLWALRGRSERLARRLTAARRHWLAALGNPARLAQLIGGAAGTIALYALVFAACAWAFSVQVQPTELAAVYLAGTALSSLVPAPSGLGAAEAALITGMVGIGVHAGPALESVLAYRFLTWWLPIPLGLLAFGRMRRAGVV